MKVILVIILATAAVILAPEIKRLKQRRTKFRRLFFFTLFTLAIALSLGELFYSLRGSTFSQIPLLFIPLIILIAAGLIIWKQGI